MSAAHTPFSTKRSRSIAGGVFCKPVTLNSKWSPLDKLCPVPPGRKQQRSQTHNSHGLNLSKGVDMGEYLEYFRGYRGFRLWFTKGIRMLLL